MLSFFTRLNNIHWWWPSWKHNNLKKTSGETCNTINYAILSRYLISDLHKHDKLPVENFIVSTICFTSDISSTKLPSVFFLYNFASNHTPYHFIFCLANHTFCLLYLISRYRCGLGLWRLTPPTFNNISVISWWSVLLEEETGVPRENHRPVASHWQALSHNIVSNIVKSGVEHYNPPFLYTGMTVHCIMYHI